MRPLRLRRGGALVALTFAGFLSLTSLAHAMKIERVVSPGGIEAWLVQEKAVPLVSMDFAFRGGSIQDPTDKAGVANMVSALLDEGAGDLDSKAYHERLEEKAIQLGFNSGRDHFRGWIRMLKENREQAFELLRLALNAPRFDPEEVERIRAQVAAKLTRETTSPKRDFRQALVVDGVPRAPVWPPGGRDARLGAAYRARRPQDLRAARVRARQSQDRGGWATSTPPRPAPCSTRCSARFPPRPISVR
jgi:predicted Zn-dependent peptidase